MTGICWAVATALRMADTKVVPMAATMAAMKDLQKVDPKVLLMAAVKAVHWALLSVRNWVAQLDNLMASKLADETVALTAFEWAAKKVVWLAASMVALMVEMSAVLLADYLVAHWALLMAETKVG